MALNICLVGFRFPITARASDQGFLWPLARGLAAKGHNVTILAAKSYLGKPTITRDGVQVFYLFDGYPNMAHMSFSEAVFTKFKELHAAKPFSILHSFDRSGYFVAKRKREFKVNIAFDVEATQINRLFSIMARQQDSLTSIVGVGIRLAYKYLSYYLGGDRELTTLADGLIVTSPQQRLFLERYYLYPDSRIHNVPYGVDSSALIPPVELNKIKKRLGLPDFAKLILCVSDFTVAEEILPLLQAFERVAVKKPDTYLALVSQNPVAKKIEYEMLNLALASRVFMVGGTSEDEISDWIADSDVFVNLSPRSSGFEPTLLEAMAQRKLVIGSELSPLSFVLEDGHDGFLIRPADVDSLANLLLEIVTGNVHVMDFGGRAREKVINLFDSQKMVENLDSCYLKIVEKGFY